MKNKILQFGEGNFMRCFVEYKLQQAKNEGRSTQGVDVITPIDTPITTLFDAQNNKYHAVLSGVFGGKTVDEITYIDVIDSVVNPYKDFASYKKLYMDESLGLLISNTTEAGIVFNADEKSVDGVNCSFPAKVTKLLLDRFEKYGKNGGLTFLCIELIENNADMLKKCILQYCDLWYLSADFVAFVTDNNTFCNTLVDRIVSGYPRDRATEFEKRLGEKDALITVGEPYFLWVIQGDKSLSGSYPFLNDDHIIFADDLKAYRERKVKVLNGSHTMMVPLALLASIETVGEAVKTSFIREFVDKVLNEEIRPTIDLPTAELDSFVGSIFERFENPFVKHSFWAISLNSTAKWGTRDLCSLDDFYRANGKIPKGLAFSFAALCEFYCQNVERIKDSAEVIDFYRANKTLPTAELVEKLFATGWWGDLKKYEGFYSYVVSAVNAIRSDGIAVAVRNYETL